VTGHLGHTEPPAPRRRGARPVPAPRPPARGRPLPCATERCTVPVLPCACGGHTCPGWTHAGAGHWCQRTGYAVGPVAAPAYSGPTCSHPHNLPYNDECSVWWLRGGPLWQLAHTQLGAGQS
jgi:hypothetical protein